jgi:transitional endoplasmic reticulum ATPase
MTEKELKLMLENGLRAESKGDISEAKACYENAVSLLKGTLRTNDPIEKERILRQIKSLERALQKFSKERSEDKPIDSPASLLNELGMTLENGNGPTMDEVAGMKNVKEELYTEIVYPLKFPELASEFNIKLGGGILLYGPPGNGKTFLIRALANDVNMNFIYVNPSNLFSQWFGNFEKNISKLFKVAKMYSPCILFFDELDSLFPTRDQIESDASRRGVSQFLNEIGGFASGEEKTPIIILGATNVPWQLDAAVTRPGRFDRMIYIPPPDIDARKSILNIYINKIKRKSSIDLDKLSEQTEGYSAADLEYVCKFATQRAFMNAVGGNSNEIITQESLEEALKSVKPSINRKVLERYEQYNKTKE